MGDRKNKHYIIVNVDNGATQRALGSHRITRNFAVWEFVSGDNSEIVLYSQRHVEILQAIRDYYDKSVTVTSGHRELTLNKEVDGFVDSEHLTGHGSDIFVDGVEPLSLWRVADVICGYYSNIGLYTGHVHIGTRGFHRRAR